MSRLLTAKTDVFGGVTVNSARSAEKDFKQKVPAVEQVAQWLEDSLKHWIAQKVNGVWFEVDLKHADWVPLLAKHGFSFHHARGAEVVMTRWLPEDKPSTLPLYPFTTVGVGGVVVNRKGEVLLMKEKRGIYLGWKFPGGMADPGERLQAAVQREVLEETGVNAEFRSVLTFRHVQKGFYPNTCDLYIVCYMQPVDEDKVDIVACERETAAAQWMSREAIDQLPANEIHQFHHIILERLDKHLASGKRGCFAEALTMNVGDFKRSWDMFHIDE